MAKRCPRCGGSGPFHKNRARYDGLSSICAACFKKDGIKAAQTPRGIAIRAWYAMYWRCENRDGNHHTYALIRLLMTRDEFLEWAVPAITLWLAENPGWRPAVIRKDTARHCELSNLEVLSVGDAAWRGHERRRVLARSLNGS